MKKIAMIVALVSLVCGIAYAETSDWDAGNSKVAQNNESAHFGF
jgi:hypothetical protein